MDAPRFAPLRHMLATDTRPVHPHLSLARFGGRALALEDLPRARLPGLHIDKIAIVESKLHGPDRGYHKRHELPLLGDS